MITEYSIKKHGAILMQNVKCKMQNAELKTLYILHFKLYIEKLADLHPQLCRTTGGRCPRHTATFGFRKKKIEIEKIRK